MLFYLLVVVLLASAQAKFYSDCGSKLASLELVTVAGCAEDAKECILKRNSNVTITMDFIPAEDAENVEAEIHGVIMNMPVPFPLSNPDACRENNLRCPLKKGDKYKYIATMPVLKSYPQIRVDVKWELKNEDGEDLVCVLIPSRIK